MEDDWNTNDIYKWNMWYRKAIIAYPTIDPLKMFVDVLLSMAKLLWYDSDAVASALFFITFIHSKRYILKDVVHFAW